MQEEPTISFYLDTRHASKKHENKFRASVRVTFQVLKNGKRTYPSSYYGPKVYLSEEEFATVSAPRAPKVHELREAQKSLNATKSKCEDIVRDYKFLTPETFDKHYNGNMPAQPKFNDGIIKQIFMEIVAEKDALGKIGTRDYYHDAMTSLLTYFGDRMTFHDVTIDKLEAYSIWMVTDGNLNAKKKQYKKTQKNNSQGTAAAYLRALRRVCKIGIERELMDPKAYPFKKGAFSIRKKRTKKAPLTVEAKDWLLTYKPVNENESKAVDFAIFSFLAFGMNFADIAYLQEDQFRIDHFTFIRRKTMDTVNEQKEIKVPIKGRLRDILNRRALYKGYVFGILNAEMTPQEKDDAIYNFRRTTNKWLKRILKKLGYHGKVSTQILRHTFTSILLNNGVPITKVKDALGHTSVAMTQDYAEDLDLDTAKGFDAMLTATSLSS